MIPDKNLAFRVYNEDDNALRGIATIDLPDMNLVTGTLKGAGIAGEIDSPAKGQFQSMVVTLHWQNLCDDSVRSIKGGVQKYTCYVVRQEYDESDGDIDESGIKIVIRGQFKGFSSGSIEQGTGSEGSTQIEATYIKIYNDSKVFVEIDKLNYIYITDGEDQLAKTRNLLGYA